MVFLNLISWSFPSHRAVSKKYMEVEFSILVLRKANKKMDTRVDLDDMMGKIILISVAQ